MMTSFYKKNGYDVEITIGSYLIDTTNQRKNNGLTGKLTITANEGSSRAAMFSFIPPETTLSLEQFKGKDVNIMLRTPADGWVQVFSGKVDTPSFDFMGRKITLSCSDRRADKIIQLPSGVVANIGTFSSDVFGPSKDAAEELDKRLQTVTSSFDFDAHGGWQLTSWYPKASPDYLFVNADISRNQNPTVEYLVNSKPINTINITVSYDYQRLHQQVIYFHWAGFDNFRFDYYDKGTPTFPTRETVNAAAAGSSNWRITTEGINYTSLWPSAYYNVGTSPSIPIYVYWKLDTNASDLCRGASWTSGIRFAQTIHEVYTINMSTPQAIALDGVVNSTETINITDPYDTSNWENSVMTANTNNNYYVDQNPLANTRNRAIIVAILKARHDLLISQRNVLVTFRTKVLKPLVDLKHTIELNINQAVTNSTAAIHSRGKAFVITHDIDFDTLDAHTVISFKLSRSQGSASDTAYTVPSVSTSPSYIGGTPITIGLATHMGVDPVNTYGADKWTGWICNNTSTHNILWRDILNPISISHYIPVTSRTTYPESFVVDFPPIPDALRLDATYSSNANLTVSIPNNLLVMST